jgi:hypothetical protein
MIKRGIKPTFIEVGKIKIGGKGAKMTSKNNVTFRPPVKYGHFVITTTEKDKDGNYFVNDKIMKAIGDKPKELKIQFLFDDPDINFFTSFQLYDGKHCKCRGDGEKATWRNDDGSKKEIVCDPEKCQHLKSAACKVSGILSCQLLDSTEAMAIYRFRTHSWNTVSGIMAALDAITNHPRNPNHILAGIPLKMKLIQKSTEEHGNVPVVTIVMDCENTGQMQTLLNSEYQSRIAYNVDIKQIESVAVKSGILVDNDDPSDVSEEFFPPKDDVKTKGVSSDEASKRLDVVAEKKVIKTVEVKKIKEDDESGSLL